MESLRVGVVGGGDIARHDHLPAYASDDRTAVVALAEVNAERRREVCREYGITTGYADGIEMLESESLDVVSICTPVTTHESLFVRAAEQGSAVYCEKPFAPTLDSAKRMAEAAAAAGVVTQAGYKYRLTRNFQRVLELHNSGVLGEIQHVSTSFHSFPITKGWYHNKSFPGGGIVMEIFAHHIDFLLELFGTTPTVRSATTRSLLSETVEDYAEMVLEFDGVEVTANVGQTQGRYALHRNHIVGRDGTVEVNPERLSVTVGSGTIGSKYEYKYGKPPDLNLYFDRFWFGASDDVGLRRIRDFIGHVVDGDCETAAPAERGVEVAEVTQEIYEQAGVVE